jgi:GTP diphosphokinase / guanosine-3',5'-bis(diphosphate) 3'-diphosphatase
MIKEILHAAQYAAWRHAGQVRKGVDAEPYINHPLRVAYILSGHIGGLEERWQKSMIVAALLHDVIEDTPATLQDLIDDVGPVAAHIVAELSESDADKSAGTQENMGRRRLQARKLAKSSFAAKLVKIADQIANVDDVAFRPPVGWSFQKRIDFVNGAEFLVDAIDVSFNSTAGYSEQDIAAFIGILKQFFTTADYARAHIRSLQTLGEA